MSGHIALLRLSWPAPALWQNRRSHWAKHAKAVAKYREEAWGAALAQSVKRLETTTPFLRFEFHPKPHGRRPDMQNMPATIKAAIDGIAQAMGCDDAGFRCIWPLEFSEPVNGGAVIVQIEADDPCLSIDQIAANIARKAWT